MVSGVGHSPLLRPETLARAGHQMQEGGSICGNSLRSLFPQPPFSKENQTPNLSEQRLLVQTDPAGSEAEGPSFAARALAGREARACLMLCLGATSVGRVFGGISPVRAAGDAWHAQRLRQDAGEPRLHFMPPC